MPNHATVLKKTPIHTLSSCETELIRGGLICRRQFENLSVSTCFLCLQDPWLPHLFLFWVKPSFPQCFCANLNVNGSTFLSSQKAHIFIFFCKRKVAQWVSACRCFVHLAWWSNCESWWNTFFSSVFRPLESQREAKTLKTVERWWGASLLSSVARFSF